MSMVIKEALSTEGDENTPYAALIVKQDRVIVCVHNETEKQLDPTNHAEINAIRCACQLLKTTDLSDCILFATCEPCPMCFGAAWWANIAQIVYGATINDAAQFESQIMLSANTLNQYGGNQIIVQGEVKRAECFQLFKRMYKID
jgi:tRNA(Arg) A34 adenosine deaminase TadA